MGEKFEAEKEQKLYDFLDGKTDEFDMWARDPDDFPWAKEVCEGFSVDSAGGMVPFQAEGTIGALAADGTHVPMRWYYRSRGGYASLKVAMVQDECYGGDPLFAAGVEEVDEFDYSRWIENLVSMVGQLQRVKFGYMFPTLLVDDQTLALHPKVAALVDEGMETSAICNLVNAAHDQRYPDSESREMAVAYLEGARDFELVSVLHGRGDTVEEAREDAKTFEPSGWLTGRGVTEEQQRAAHELRVAHMCDQPFNPWLWEEMVDDRTKPEVELAAEPFVLTEKARLWLAAQQPG